MSEESREIYKEEIKEEHAAYDESATEQAETSDDLRMQRRRARVRGRKRRRKVLSIVLIVAIFALLATMCGRDILRLKAENISLQKQQKELEEERNKLQKEVDNMGNREFVQDQARKQLKLLNPGELLFTFDEEE